MLTPEDNEARVKGLLAVLALPAVRDEEGRERRRVVEIEYRPGQWEQVDGCSVDGDKLIFWRGRNGTSVQFSCPPSRCPPWRMDRPTPRYFVEDEVGAR